MGRHGRCCSVSVSSGPGEKFFAQSGQEGGHSTVGKFFSVHSLLNNKKKAIAVFQMSCPLVCVRACVVVVVLRGCKVEGAGQCGRFVCFLFDFFWFYAMRCNDKIIFT